MPLGFGNLSTGNLFSNIADFIGLKRKPQKLISPIPDSLDIIIKQRQPEVMGTRDVNYSDVIRRGFEEYAPNTPVSQYSNVFAEAPKKHSIYKEYPYLLPAVSILETSGGRNITYENNPLNWGIYPQKKGLFNPQSQEEVIRKAISGIGERMGAYEPFRESRDIADFASTYAPPNENLTKQYIEDLKKYMKMFEELE